MGSQSMHSDCVRLTQSAITGKTEKTTQTHESYRYKHIPDGPRRTTASSGRSPAQPFGPQSIRRHGYLTCRSSLLETWLRLATRRAPGGRGPAQAPSGHLKVLVVHHCLTPPGQADSANSAVGVFVRLRRTRRGSFAETSHGLRGREQTPTA